MVSGRTDVDGPIHADYRVTMTAGFDSVEALVFDMFGTVVDWRNSVSAEVAVHLRDHVPISFRGSPMPGAPNISRRWSGCAMVTGSSFVWMCSTGRISRPCSGVSASIRTRFPRRSSTRPILRGIGGSIRGRMRSQVLTRLKQTVHHRSLSNANIRLALGVAKRAGLAWDAILGAEVAAAYKPDPDAYLRTAEILGLEPHQVAMVAAHNSDLAAAQSLGLRTAFVRRPTEHGPDQTIDLEPTGDWDIVAEDFEDLADQIS